MLKMKVTELKYTNEEKIVIPKKKVLRAIQMGVKKADSSTPRFQKRIVLSLAGLLFISIGTLSFNTGYAQEILGKFPIVYHFFEDFSFFGKNQSDSFILKSEGDYQFLNQTERSAGIYDIELIEGDIATFGGNIINKNQRYTGVYMEDTNWTTITGEEIQLKWSPTTQEKVPFVDGAYVFKNHLGNFQIGEVIEPGDYKVTVETDAEKFHILVGTRDNIAKGMTEETKYESRMRSFSDSGPVEEVIHLAKGSILEISDSSHLSYEEGAKPVVTKKNIKVTLTKISD